MLEKRTGAESFHSIRDLSNWSGRGMKKRQTQRSTEKLGLGGLGSLMETPSSEAQHICYVQLNKESGLAR